MKVRGRGLLLDLANRGAGESWLVLWLESLVPVRWCKGAEVGEGAVGSGEECEGVVLGVVVAWSVGIDATGGLGLLILTIL